MGTNRTPAPPRQSGAPWGWVAIAVAIAGEALVVGAWAAGRGVNADEGFYLAAGRHAAAGLSIYADFFFPQMPYLPWLEGVLFRWVGPSLDAGRAIGVVAAALSAGLLAAVAWKESRSATVTLVLSLFFVASALMIRSQSVLKTVAPSNLGLLLAFALLVVPRPRPLWALVAGLAAGWAVGVRLPVAPAAVVLAAMAWRSGPVGLGAYALGAALASVPWLVVAARSPEQFWFCNFGFHALRREISGWAPILAQKAGIVAKWCLLPQHLIAWGLAAFGVWRAPRQAGAAAFCALVLAAAYVSATPTYLEYMAQFFPFLLLAAVPALTALAKRPAVLTAVAAAYLLGLYPLLSTPEQGTAMAAERELWSRGTVAEVSGFVAGSTAADETVLSWWEGYPVLAGRPGVLGVGFWESNAARKLGPQRARRFHVRRRDEVRALIRRGEPAAIVVADGVWEPMRSDIEARYALARRVASVRIYLRRHSG